nr:pyridoxal-phosphate dependent enzyme [Bacilli bacterium]
MQIKCDVCGKIFKFPFEINTHKHVGKELNGVPVNFWTTLNDKFDLIIDDNMKGVFRYKDLYKKTKKNISLDEGNTPLIKVLDNLYIKDESVNPTGSFKDRGMPFLMNEVLNHNKSSIAICSTGNAAISLIKYAKLYGIESIVFLPQDIDFKKKNELTGATQIVYSDDIIKCFEDFMIYCDNNPDIFNGFLSTNISYMIGLETISYEIFEQLNFNVPNYIFIPCASGGNVVSQYNAWKKLYDNNMIDKMPKFVIVQIDGGNPIEQGYNKKNSESLFVINNPVPSKTILSTDTCFNYFKIYEIIDSGYGFTVSIDDKDIDNIAKTFKDKYDYTSLAVLAAYEKYKKNMRVNEISVAIITAKNRK